MRGTSDPVPERADPAPAAELFGGLGLAHSRRRPALFVASAMLHVVLVAGAVLGAILWPEPLPDQGDAVYALLYDPPPPPPPPPLLGSELALRQARPRPAAVPPTPPPDHPPLLVAPDLTPPAPAHSTEEAAGGEEQPGSPKGSELGDPLGMEGGVLGGEVGGVPGGVLGGVVGGTGHNLPEPVRTPDQPARLLRQVRPRYPEDAFNKKIQGTVTLEILIDADGRVAWARVVGSLPGLDAAAVEAVRQWVFAPAVHRGRPVASLARTPITFRIL